MTALPKAAAGGLLLLLLILTAVPAAAGTVAGPPPAPPPLADTVPTDTVPADPVPVEPAPADTVPGDTLPADTLPADTVPPDPEADPEEEEEEELPDPHDFPELPEGVRAGWGNAVWEWDRAALLTTSAMTLEELLRTVPGAITLRTGDYGNPAVPSAFGLDGGRIRILLGGFEMAPLEGGVADLSQIPLAGLESVRVERRPGEIRVELEGLKVADGRPYSFVQAGTGDLNTDYFRGAFAHPRALGGNVVLGLERVGTAGPGREEPASQFGAAFRYSIHQGDRGGVGIELRRGRTDRVEGLFDPQDLVRTDWVLRARRELAEGVVADAFYGRSALAEGGDDPLDTLAVTALDRSQLGARVGVRRGGIWGEAGYRQQWGGGWPSSRAELRGGVERAGLGGVEGTLEREGWSERGALGSARVRAWTAPLLGTSLFVQGERGRRGVPFVPPRLEPPGENGEENGLEAGGNDEAHRVQPRVTDRTGFRAGAEFARGGVFLGGAYLFMDADSVHPLGLSVDRDGVSTAAGSQDGFEVSGRVPVPILDGLAVEGSYTRWLTGTDLRYLPREVWHAGLTFRDTFRETESLEVWADLGVRGREAMRVPLALPDSDPADPMPDLQVVPSYMNWSFRLQVRVQMVHAFVHWENLTFRSENQDFPGRILPGSRAYYGLRWTMWN